MNNTESRFMRIKRFSEEEVAMLHNAERDAGIAWSENFDKPERRGEGWRIVGAQKLGALEVGKPAFWNTKTPEDERARSIDAFVKSPPVRRAHAMLDDFKVTEIAAQHSADWVVWKLAPNIGTGMADAIRSGENAGH